VGHTIDEWTAKVAGLVADIGGRDIAAPSIVTVGILPALAEHNKRSPRELTVEVSGNGTSHLPLPDEWDAELSVLLDVEYPARQDPPRFQRPGTWRVLQGLTDVTEQEIVLQCSPTSTEYVRLTFLAPWPVPTDDDPPVDALSDRQFEAVAALAAAYCCENFAALSSRSRAGGIPSDFSDGTQRSVRLSAMADRFRDRYDSMADRRVVIA
jgi:hypothetical protein